MVVATSAVFSTYGSIHRYPMDILKLLGVGFLAWAAWSLVNGRVFVKSGMWGVWVEREEEPFRFWSSVILYAVLGIGALTMEFWRAR